MSVRMKAMTPVPADIVAAVRLAEPTVPPAEITPGDDAIKFNFRLRTSTANSIEARAGELGLSMKLLLMRGLQEMGVQVAASDLVDGSPKARRKR